MATIVEKIVSNTRKKTDDYDWESYEKENGLANLSGDKHFPDKYKNPNHITFSDESIHSNKDTPGGKWSQGEDKVWHFAPSDYNIKVSGKEKLIKYFKDKEKDSILGMK